MQVNINAISILIPLQGLWVQLRDILSSYRRDLIFVGVPMGALVPYGIAGVFWRVLIPPQDYCDMMLAAGISFCQFSLTF